MLQMFELHYLVRIGTHYYDPSFGGPRYASLGDWERACVGGYWNRSTMWDPLPVVILHAGPSSAELGHLGVEDLSD
jgi:hypothetical protein